MPFLVAALIGGVLALCAYLVVARVTGRKITWKHALAALVGGAIGGLVVVALLPAGFASATAGEGLAVAGLSGASGGGSEQVVNNALAHQPLGHGVVESALVAGGTAILFRGGQELLGPRVAEALPQASKIPGRATEEVTRIGRKLTEQTVKSLDPSSVSAGVGAASPGPEKESRSSGIVGALGQ